VRKPTSAKPVRRTYRSGGLRLSYIDWSGPASRPMVLIHDLGDSPRTWDLLVPRFRGEHHVFAPELRGHGDSDRPPRAEYEFEHLYSDLVTFVAEINLQSAVVVGHGAGARLAGRLAVESPAAVSALVLYELESTEGHTETAWKSFDEVVAYLKRQRPGASEAVLDRQGRSLTGGGLDGGRSFKHDTAAHPGYMADTGERWHNWAAIACPTLVLRGRLSRDLPHDEAVRIAESIEKSRLAEIEETGHWLHHEQPTAFEDTLRWFLDFAAQIDK
jgi:esterase